MESYIDNNMLQWFAAKVFYNKVFEVEKRLREFEIETYIPLRVVEKKIGDHTVYVEKPAVSSLLFFRSNERNVYELNVLFEGWGFIYKNVSATKWAVIPEHDMRVFMLVTSKHKDGLAYFDGNAKKFCRGQRVRVIDGPFKGAEGYIHRIKGNRRLIVTIEGIVAVATAYIPSIFLQNIESQ